MAPARPTKATITLVDRSGRAVIAPRDVVLNVTITSLNDFALAKVQWIKEVAGEQGIKLAEWPPRGALPLKVISSDADILSWALPASLKPVIDQMKKEMRTPLAGAHALISLDFWRTTEFTLGKLPKGTSQASFKFSTSHIRGTLGVLVEAKDLGSGTAFLQLQVGRGIRDSVASLRPRALTAYAAAQQLWPVILRFQRRDDGVDDGVWEYDVLPVIDAQAGQERILSTPCTVKLAVDRAAYFMRPDGKRARSTLVNIPAGRSQAVRAARLVSEAGFFPQTAVVTASITVTPLCPVLISTDPEFLLDFPPRPHRILIEPNVRTALANGHDPILIQVYILDRTDALLTPAMEGLSKWVVAFGVKGSIVIDQVRHEVVDNDAAVMYVRAVSNRVGKAGLGARLMLARTTLTPEWQEMEFRDLWAAGATAIIVALILGALYLGGPGFLSATAARAIVAGALAFGIYYVLYYQIVPQVEIAEGAAKFLIRGDNISWSALAGVPIGVISGLLVHVWPRAKTDSTDNHA